MHMMAVYLVFLLCVVSVCSAAECHGSPDPNAKTNNIPIQDGPLKFIKQIKNAKLYQAGENEDQFSVVHVWGTPYEMGLAHGQIMSESARGMMDDVWRYLQLQVVEAINGTIDIFPKWFLNDVANIGLEAALDLNIAITKVYTGNYFYEEIQGLADGAKIDKKKIERIHMIGELTKGSCSMVGANGTAVVGGGLLQLRALDWNVDGPFKNYPQVTVYHPARGNGHAFANIGWTAWIGSITGFSEQSMAICEIGVSFPDDTFGKESRFGIPFTYLLRDILQFDNSLEESLTRITTANRTCDLILGVGDAKINQFRGIEYSASTANFYTWDNLEPLADWHPRIKDTVYWGMDWLCPGYSKILSEQLEKYHGQLTPDILIHNILPIIQSGDLHIAIYDMINDNVFISNARADNESAGQPMAYDRPFVRLNMKSLFDETPPTL